MAAYKLEKKFNDHSNEEQFSEKSRPEPHFGHTIKDYFLTPGFEGRVEPPFLTLFLL